ncbi:MAG TPA: hypothetical protein VIJ84_09040 [Gaiellaceae bacterium]
MTWLTGAGAAARVTVTGAGADLVTGADTYTGGAGCGGLAFTFGSGGNGGGFFASALRSDTSRAFNCRARAAIVASVLCFEAVLAWTPSSVVRVKA